MARWAGAGVLVADRVFIMQGYIAEAKESRRRCDKKTAEYEAARLKNLGHKNRMDIRVWLFARAASFICAPCNRGIRIVSPVVCFLRALHMYNIDPSLADHGKAVL